MTGSLRLIHKIERVVLGAYALLIGAPSLLMVILPRAVLHEFFRGAPSSTAIIVAQLLAGAQIGLAMVALVAALLPQPPRMLLRALTLALVASLAGPLFSVMTQASVYTADVHALLPLLLCQGFVALVLGLLLGLERVLQP